jgi:3-oxoacyl-[acyl-carrier protein] reductase
VSEPIAVVTGGSTGIGASICTHLLGAGWRVINLARRPSDIDHPRIENIEIDLADRAATVDVAAAIAARTPVNALVHNAGLIRPAVLEQVTLEDLDYLSEVHLAAAITLTQAFLPAMKSARFGRIVLIGSRGVLGLRGRTNYAATKFAMTALVRTWAVELGAHGITANCVAPGPIGDTEMFHGMFPDGGERVEALARSIPVGRLGRPDDVARAVLFMLAPENSFVTGQTLMVCGGASIGTVPL